MEYLDSNITTLYAALIEQLQSDKQSGIPSYGSFTKKERENTIYYHQFRFEDKTYQKSLGRDVPIDQWRQALKQRERLCALLQTGGMVALRPQSPMARTLGLLDSLRVFETGSVLIGSHAFAAICNMLGIQVSHQLTTTQDVDFGIDRSIQVTGKKPELEKTLMDAGMLAIPGLDRPPTASSFQTRDRKVKVDFLTPAKGKESGKAVRVHQLGVHADQLKYLDYLIERPIQAALITKYGTLVTVPRPARFALHKIIIATQRPVTFEAKRKKDIHQASLLFEYLADHRPFDIEEAWHSLAGKGWRDQARKGFSMMDQTIYLKLTDYLAD
ncbi:MAG: GSU2403 family nucleotidyltransferase fold protein [Mariprofundaceae bacterium]